MKDTKELNHLDLLNQLKRKVRKISDEQDIFSGEKTPILKEERKWIKSRPYEDTEMNSVSYTYLPGEGGVLYSVTFNAPFSLKAGIETVYDSLIKQNMIQIRKAVKDEAKLDQIRTVLETNKESEVTGIRELFELGSHGYTGFGSNSLPRKSDGKTALFFAGEKNLRTNVTLEEMMKNSAIAQQLTQAYQTLPAEYRNLVSAVLTERIEVICERLRYLKNGV